MDRVVFVFPGAQQQAADSRLFRKIDPKCSFSLLRTDKQITPADRFLPDSPIHGPKVNFTEKAKKGGVTFLIPLPCVFGQCVPKNRHNTKRVKSLPPPPNNPTLSDLNTRLHPPHMNVMSQRIVPSLKTLIGSWLCCNLAFWLGMLPILAFSTRSSDAGNDNAFLVIGYCTGLYLLILWFVLALPFELLRAKGLGSMTPRQGAIIGLTASLPFVLFVLGLAVWTVVHESSMPGRDLRTLLLEVSLDSPPFLLAMLATGFSAGWLRQQTTPKEGPSADSKALA